MNQNFNYEYCNKDPYILVERKFLIKVMFVMNVNLQIHFTDFGDGYMKFDNIINNIHKVG